MSKTKKRASNENVVSFQIDDQARESLSVLESVYPGSARKRSAVIRKALNEAAVRVVLESGVPASPWCRQCMSAYCGHLHSRRCSVRIGTAPLWQCTCRKSRL